MPKLTKEAQVNRKMAKNLDRGIIEMSSQIARYEKIDNYVNKQHRDVNTYIGYHQ